MGFLSDLFIAFRDSQSPQRAPKKKSNPIKDEFTYLTTSYAKLVELFGAPNGTADGYKTTCDWRIPTHHGTVEIYDYKATSAYDSDLPSPSEFKKRARYNWHVQGNAAAVAEISAKLAAARLARKPPRRGKL